MNTTLAHAMEYHTAGLAVIPLNRFDAIDEEGKELGKKPLGGWRRWQRHQQTADDVERLFAGHDGNMAVIGGRETSNGWLYFAEFDDTGRWPETAQELAHAGIDTWQTQSKRGGHIWGASSKPVRTRKYKWGEIRGVGAYLAVPPSIHPSGTPYAFRSKPEHIARLDSMPGLPALEFTEPLPDKLPRLAIRILSSDPATLTRYHSRSETDYALIVSLVNAGFSAETIQAILYNATYPSHCRDLAEPTRTNWFMAAYLKAKGQGNTAAFKEAQAQAKRVQLWALAAPVQEITGNARTGATDRAVLIAHAVTAAKVGRLEYQLSARDGAELAKMHAYTFNKASGRLTKAGLIQPTKKGLFGLASRWELKPNLDKVSTLTYTPGNVCECTNLVQTDTRGIFSQRRSARKRTAGNVGMRRPKPPQGLGRAAGDTWQRLIGAQMTTDEIAEASGRCLRTIKRHLERLSGVGLVSFDGDAYTYTAVTLPQVIERAASQLATTEVDGKRADRHKAERETYRTRLAEGGAGNRIIDPKRGFK